MTLFTLLHATNIYVHQNSIGGEFSLNQSLLSEKANLSIQWQGIDRAFVTKQNIGGVENTQELIGFLNTLSLGGRYQINENFGIGAQVNAHSANEFSLGDSKIIGEVKLKIEEIDFGLIPNLVIPTGEEGKNLGVSGFSGGIDFVTSKKFDLLLVQGNIGFQHDQGNRMELGFDLENRVVWGLSGAYSIDDSFKAHSEIRAYTSLPTENEQNGFLFGIGLTKSFENLNIKGTFLTSFSSEDSQNVGGAIGFEYRFEEKKADESRELASQVRYTRSKLVLDEEIRFALGEPRIDFRSKPLMEEIAKEMIVNAHRFERIIIEAHADEIGAEKTNWTLSVKRALNVKKALVDLGVPKKKLIVRPYGEYAPKRGLASDAKDGSNRRVSFTVLE